MPLFRYVLMLFVSFTLLASCKKSDDKDSVTGRFTEHRSCTVIAPPSGVDIDTFYTSYINCSGIAVVGAPGVTAEALYRADSIIAFLLDGLEPVRDELMRQGVYHVLYAPGMTPNDMPEKQGESFSYGAGSFIPHKQVSITSMANILCLATDDRNPLDSELIHEFGHNLHVHGLAIVYPDFAAELSAAYQNALALGIWDSTYLAANDLHYFEEGMQIWYGVNRPGPQGGDGNSNHIGTREQLRTYDLTLYNLLDKYLNNRTDVPVCF